MRAVLFLLLLPLLFLLLHSCTPVSAKSKVGDPYQVLGIQRGATLPEIKKAHKQLALKWHPDKNGNSPESQAKYLEITEAYDMLTNEDIKFQWSPPFANQHGIHIQLTSGHLGAILLVIIFISFLINKVARRRRVNVPVPGEYVGASFGARIFAGLVDVIFYNSNYTTLKVLVEKLLEGETKVATNASTIVLLLASTKEKKKLFTFSLHSAEKH